MSFGNLFVNFYQLFSHISGVIIAIYGKEPDEDRGKFYVEDCCFQDLPDQIPRPKLSQDRYVIITLPDQIPSQKLLTEFVRNNNTVQPDTASKIVTRSLCNGTRLLSTTVMQSILEQHCQELYYVKNFH